MMPLFTAKQKIGLLIVAVALIGGLFTFTQTQKAQPVATPTPQASLPKIKTDVVVKYGTKPEDTFPNIEIEEGTTALGVTQKVTKVTASGEGATAFVTGINGKIADSAKKEFWELLVNGKSSEVGAGSYKIKDGDKIEWRISSY